MLVGRGDDENGGKMEENAVLFSASGCCFDNANTLTKAPAGSTAVSTCGISQKSASTCASGNLGIGFPPYILQPR